MISDLFLIVLIGIILYILFNKNEYFTLPMLGPLYINNDSKNLLIDNGLKNIIRLYCPDDKILYNGGCYDKSQNYQNDVYNLDGFAANNKMVYN